MYQKQHDITNGFTSQVVGVTNQSKSFSNETSDATTKMHIANATKFNFQNNGTTVKSATELSDDSTNSDEGDMTNANVSRGTFKGTRVTPSGTNNSEDTSSSKGLTSKTTSEITNSTSQVDTTSTSGFTSQLIGDFTPASKATTKTS